MTFPQIWRVFQTHTFSPFQELVTQLTQEKENLEALIGELKEDIQQLETKVAEARERERLIVEYPDLNGPVNPDLMGEFIMIASSRFISVVIQSIYLTVLLAPHSDGLGIVLLIVIVWHHRHLFC